jgi:pimeloyl-ACP methyl ester carboxylesterase
MPHRLFLALPPLAAALLAVHPLAAQTIAPHWEGVMVQQGASLPISVDFSRRDTILTATWSAPSMRALRIPLQRIQVGGGVLRFALVGDQNSTEFEGRLQGDSLVGTFSGGEGSGTLRLVQRPVPAPAYREEEVSISNGAVTLSGTLLTPAGPGRHPAVVFVHGSGPEGRFASRFLAEYLAGNGVAALVFDKRGVATSTGDWKNATLEDLAGDALAGIELLRARPGIAADRVGIYGHSQGGLIAPIAAARSPHVGFIVAGATYGGTVFEQDLYRVSNSLKRSDLSEPYQVKAMSFYRRFIQAARTGAGIDGLLAAGDSVKGEAWYQWLGIPPRDHWLWSFYPPVGNFDPLPVWERVTVPTLLLYGQNDQLIPVDSSLARIGRALDRGGNTRWAAVLLPRAAHNLTISPGPGEPFEWRRVAPGLPDIVLGWVKGRSAM